MDEFYTRGTANEGIRIDLYLPNGDKSDHWIEMRGVYSDEYRRAYRRLMAKISDAAKGDDTESRSKRLYDYEIELLSYLVKGWSFDKKPTQKNIIYFLMEAPQVADSLDFVANDNKVFLEKKLLASSNGVS